MISGYLIMLSEGVVEKDVERLFITNKTISQEIIRSDEHPDTNEILMIQGEDTQQSNDERNMNIKTDSSIRSLVPEGKIRERRSYGFKSVCIPRILKKCIIVSHNGIKRPFCLYVNKNFCYGLD